MEFPFSDIEECEIGWGRWFEVDGRMDKSHKRLDVWQKSLDFAKSIYEVTSKYPSEEKYGLISQMR